MISADSESETLAVCYESNILNEDNELIRMDKTTPDELSLQIKSILLHIRKQILKNDEAE